MSDTEKSPEKEPLTEAEDSPNGHVSDKTCTRQDSIMSNGSHYSKVFRKQLSREDSRFSKQSHGSFFLRHRPSYRRQSSLGMPHVDSFKSLILEPKDVIAEKKEGVPFWTSKRFCLAIICFTGFFCLYAQRVDLSIAIVCMVKNENAFSNSNESTFMFLNDTMTTHTQNSTDWESEIVYNGSSHILTGRRRRKICPGQILTGSMEWDKPLQGLILGAFFWGYTALQIPGGWLAERFGPRLAVAAGMLSVSTLTLLTPVCARLSPYLLIICRIFIGMGEATMYPGAQVLWSKWSPPEERSRLVGFSFGGCQLGNALSFPIGSLLCAYGFDGGWPSIFYFIGMLSTVWCFVWIIFVRNSPSEMPNMNPLEKEYIMKSLHDKGNTDKEKEKKAPKPWKAILTSPAVWAILIANACGNYGAYMLLTQMPSYMKEVLKFDITKNGIFSMIPYLFFWMFIILAGFFADFFIARTILSIATTRKMCCAIGMFVPAAFLIGLGYMDCSHQTAAVVLLTASMAFCGFQFSSFFINHGDIAPKYAGTIFGITNMGASIPGILAPFIVAEITQNKTQGEWQIAFYVAAVIQCLGAIVYIILAKGEIQDWADPDNDIQEPEKSPIQLDTIQEMPKVEGSNPTLV